MAPLLFMALTSAHHQHIAGWLGQVVLGQAAEQGLGQHAAVVAAQRQQLRLALGDDLIEAGGQGAGDDQLLQLWAGLRQAGGFVIEHLPDQLLLHGQTLGGLLFG